MMKKITFLCLLLSTSCLLSAQVIYLSSLDNKLYRLDLNDCSLEFIVNVQNQMYDISFHPNGNLYGISGPGELYEIDTLVGATTSIHTFFNQTYNSLTVAGDGTIYTTGDAGTLWTYNLSTGTAGYVGNIGYPATGDLTFYEGDLYVASTFDRIVRIDLAVPSGSTVVINGNLQEDIYGIVSHAGDCNDVRTYAITGGNSNIYEINFDNSSLDFLCDLDIEVGGGASTFEFFASSPLVLDNIETINPDCHSNNGIVLVQATGGNGQVTYSLDGINFQDSNEFENLGTGTYTLTVSDENGCTITEEVFLIADNAPVISQTEVMSATCGYENGAIIINASGGTGTLTYSINGIDFQASNSFDNLPGGIYLATVTDMDDCSTIMEVVVLEEDAPVISQIIKDDTSCGEENGSISISTIGGTGSLLFSLNNMGTQQNGTFDNLPPGSYAIEVEDENGCRVSSNTVIEPSEPLFIESIETIPALCEEGIGFLDITANRANGNLSVSLNNIDFQQGQTISNLFAGNYTVFIQDADGCTASEEVEIEGSPALFIQSLELASARCGSEDGSVLIETTGGTGEILFALNDDVAQSNPLIENLAADAYALIASDELGCEADSTFNLLQEDCGVYIPNVFSPNNDGANDFFRPFPHPAFMGSIETFKIFDRWGGLVFEANGSEAALQGWDGQYQGQPANLGVYAFFVEMIMDDGRREFVEGDVTLIR